MKKYLMGFILGIIVMGTIGIVYAITADSIGYNDTTVKEAIDNLYIEANSNLINKLDLTPDFVYSVGYRTGPKTISINVDSGSYLIVFTSGYGWNSTNWTPTITNAIEERINNDINCTPIIQKKLVNSADGNANFTGTAVYKCVFTSSDTVSFSHNQTAASGMTENFLLYSIKID